MTRIKVEVDGLNSVTQQLIDLGVAADETVEETKTMLAFDTQALAVTGIQRSGGGGRTYVKNNPRRTHTASRPGQYPSTDLGGLAASIGVAKQGDAVLVGTALMYGKYLEFGTSRMAARPWLLRSFKQAMTDLAAELKARLEARIK